MDPFDTPPAIQSSADPFGTPPATPRLAVDVADFVNALWRRRGARGARHWSAGGAIGGMRRVSAGGARYLMMESQGCAQSATLERRRRDRRSALHRRPSTLPDGGVAGCARERALERRRRDRRSTLAGRRWSRRSARGARHWSAEGATGGARVSAGGARWHTVESQAKRGARDSARSEAIKYVTF